MLHLNGFYARLFYFPDENDKISKSGKVGVFMKDLIEERDRREKIHNSIIKSWNVHYMTPEELEALQQQNEAAEVYERLAAEAAADEAKLQAEIEDAKQKAMSYNKLTGAYSGEYGKQEMDSVTQGQIEKILGEKEAAIRSVIEEEARLDEQMEILGQMNAESAETEVVSEEDEEADVVATEDAVEVPDAQSEE